MRKVLLGAVAVGAIGLAAGSARADLANGPYTVNIWNGTFNNGVSDKATQSLPPSSQLIASFTYTGPINFVNSVVQGSNTFGDFFDGLLTTSSTNLSASALSALLAKTMSTDGEIGSATNSILQFTGTVTAAAGTTVTSTHDDGVDLLVGSTEVIQNPGPESKTVDSDPLPGGTNPFSLVYAETNGSPAILQVSVPEPASIGLLGLGALGVTFMRRRKSAKVAS